MQADAPTINCNGIGVSVEVVLRPRLMKVGCNRKVLIAENAVHHFVHQTGRNPFSEARFIKVGWFCATLTNIIRVGNSSTNWFKRFHSGKFDDDFKGELRSGRPVTDKVDAIFEKVERDRWKILQQKSYKKINSTFKIDEGNTKEEIKMLNMHRIKDVVACVADARYAFTQRSRTDAGEQLTRAINYQNTMRFPSGRH
ncbi:hypothetical protein EVAR_60471_1 [Eumeta japonica]|uniref:Uncharacterized protein n=1 Tax=Eumeta variegata TaxID=151549 RepID=A0A4C1ZLL2_EUMVA|nr:hypothetical protein EVAR_60471_1 [Eumeta japonica]